MTLDMCGVFPVMLMATKVPRPKVQIMAEILELCKEPQFKTHVMYKTNLSWQMLQKYLSHLQSLGFLEIRHSPRKYATTQKGAEFASKWKDVIDLLLPT